MTRPRSAPSRRSRRRASSLRDGDRPGRGIYAACQRGPAGRRGHDHPPAQDIAALLAAHPCRVGGASSTRVRRAWYSVRSGFHRSGGRAHRRRNRRHGAGRSGLPGSIRSQQAAYGVHPALLDACFQSVAAHPGVRQRRHGGLLLPLGVRRLRAHGPAPQRPLLLHPAYQSRRRQGRRRPRCLGRARDGPARCTWAADVISSRRTRSAASTGPTQATRTASSAQGGSTTRDR